MYHVALETKLYGIDLDTVILLSYYMTKTKRKGVWLGNETTTHSRLTHGTQGRDTEHSAIWQQKHS